LCRPKYFIGFFLLNTRTLNISMMPKHLLNIKNVADSICRGSHLKQMNGLQKYQRCLHSRKPNLIEVWRKPMCNRGLELPRKSSMGTKSILAWFVEGGVPLQTKWKSMFFIYNWPAILVVEGFSGVMGNFGLCRTLNGNDIMALTLCSWICAICS
jgi:hypothetical protein